MSVIVFFAVLGVLIFLKICITLSSIIDEKVKTPPDKPLKKLYYALYMKSSTSTLNIPE